MESCQTSAYFEPATLQIMIEERKKSILTELILTSMSDKKSDKNMSQNAENHISESFNFQIFLNPLEGV